MKFNIMAAAFAAALSAGVMAAAPTDAEIAKIVEATNTGEIALAKLAKEKSNNPEVKKFADHMIMDHSENNKKSAEILKKNKMTPEESAKSVEMKANAEMSKTKLQTLSGTEFDKAYISDQIATHEKVLKSFENEFIPSAKNDELKSLLTSTKPKIEGHLKHAKEIQGKM